MTESATSVISGFGHTTIHDSRRYTLLSVSLFAGMFIGGVFCIINFMRGHYLLAVVETVVVVICLVLKYKVKSPKHLDFACLFFVLLTCAFGLIAFWAPNSHVSVFVWPLMGPLLSFFLLGKRKGLIISSIFMTMVIAIFLKKYAFGPDSLPMIALANFIIFTITASIIALYYESTRAETEQALVKRIAAHERSESEKEKLIRRLRAALMEVETLSGLLPICANCKKIRDDKGYWNQIEEYIQLHSGAEFSHSICPDCMYELYPEIAEKVLERLD